MLVRLALAFGLLGACVAIHAAMLTVALRRIGPPPTAVGAADWRVLWRLIRVASWLVAAHLIEIVVWGTAYAVLGVFPDPETAAYFSAVTYTTVGYGDLVPPAEWRLLAGMEGLTGILMCGWSTGYFFAVVSRIHMGHDR